MPVAANERFRRSGVHEIAQKRDSFDHRQISTG